MREVSAGSGGGGGGVKNVEVGGVGGEGGAGKGWKGRDGPFPAACEQCQTTTTHHELQQGVRPSALANPGRHARHCLKRVTWPKIPKNPRPAPTAVFRKIELKNAFVLLDISSDILRFLHTSIIDTEILF